jgi:hypothetical protein
MCIKPNITVKQLNEMLDNHFLAGLDILVGFLYSLNHLDELKFRKLASEQCSIKRTKFNVSEDWFNHSLSNKIQQFLQCKIRKYKIITRGLSFNWR